MPQGTRVKRCVKKVKKSGRGVNPYAVCQASTQQSYATGKKLESTMKYYITPKGRDLLEESRLKKAAAAAALTAALVGGGKAVSKERPGDALRGAGISYQHAATPVKGSGIQGGYKGKTHHRRKKQARADAEGGPASVIRRLSPRGK
jgi:hypothetical protein